MPTEDTLIEESTPEKPTFSLPDEGEIASEPTGTVEGAEPSGEEEGEEVDVQPKPKTAVQKRIDELTKKRYEAERRAAYLEGQLKAREPERKPPADLPLQIKPKPNPSDFENYEEYTEALTDWKVDLKIADYDRQAKEKAEEARLFASQVSFREKLAVGRERYEDFDEVVSNPTAPISVVMADIIQGCEDPAEIAYYLCKNWDISAPISRMTPVQAARAIGNIEAEIKGKLPNQPPKPKVSKAPEPIKPVGGSEVVSKDPEKMSNEEFRRWRRGET